MADFLTAAPELMEFQRDQVRQITQAQQAEIARLENVVAELEDRLRVRDTSIEDIEVPRLAFLLERLETAVGEAGVTLFKLYENELYYELATELHRALRGRPQCRALCPTCKRERCEGCVRPGADVCTEDAVVREMRDFRKALEGR